MHGLGKSHLTPNSLESPRVTGYLSALPLRIVWRLMLGSSKAHLCPRGPGASYLAQASVLFRSSFCCTLPTCEDSRPGGR